MEKPYFSFVKKAKTSNKGKGKKRKTKAKRKTKKNKKTHSHQPRFQLLIHALEFADKTTTVGKEQCSRLSICAKATRAYTQQLADDVSVAGGFILAPYN